MSILIGIMFYTFLGGITAKLIDNEIEGYPTLSGWGHILAFVAWPLVLPAYIGIKLMELLL
jgi:hypothetical protein